MNWYYAEAGKQVGPVTDAELEHLIHTYVITDETLLWHEGMAAWAAYQTLKSTILPHTVPPPTSSSPAMAAQPAPTAPLAGTAQPNLEYAGFWIRLVAKFLDGVLICVVIVVPAIIVGLILGVTGRFHASPGSVEIGILANLMGFVFELVAIAFQVAYGTFFLGKYSATPGKMICGLKVIRANGERVSYGLGFGRCCAEILSGLTCYIGYIMAGFDGQKRALHDHICSTRVVYK